MENGSTPDDTVDIHSSNNTKNDTANVAEIGNFVKCHKAIQEVCLKAANCVKNVLDGWHKRMRKGEFGIKKCTSPSKCKKVKGRPINKKAKGGACLNCANWADEIENVVFPNDEKTIDGLCWRNVKSPLFETGSLQVAKVFVYNTPEERISEITDFTMFDGGSLLMIMKTFSEFLEDDHQRADKKERQDDESASMFTLESSESGSTPSSDSAELKRKRDYAHTIDEVLQIRNRLCHIDVGSNLQIPDEQLEEYFTNIRRLVFNMESLGHFKKRECKDINTSLSKMSREKVTADMIEATRHQLCTSAENFETAEDFETAIEPLTILQQNIGTVVQQAGKINTYKYVEKEIHYHIKNDKYGLCMLPSDEAKDSPRKHQQGMNAVGNVPYNQVKGDVEDSLPPDKLKKIKRLLLVDPDLGFGISRESVNRIENNEDLMNCLEDHKLLGPYNLVFLPILLLLVNCDELKNKFDDLAEHMRTRNNVDPLSLCKVGTKIENNFLVELKIQGDRKYLRGYDIETFRRRLASQLLIEEQNVRFEAAGLGCFVIVFILPEKVRSTLRLAATERAKWLQEAEIIGVHIEDEDYISLLDTDNANAYDDHPEHFDDDKSETLSHLTSVPEENDSVSGTQQDVQAKKTETQHKEEKSLQNTQESMPQTEAMNFEDGEFRELAEIRDLKENWEVVADNMGFNKPAKDLLWNEGNGHEDDHCISIVVYNMLTKWQATQPQVLDFRKALSKVLEKSGLHDLAEHVLHPVENRGLTTVTSKTIEEPDADDITSGKDFENIEEPWEGFQAQVEDILDRKHRFLQFKTKLPAFKKSVRKLQEDMAKMAKKLKVLAFKYRKQHQMNIVSGNHLFASLNLASHAIQMYIDCGVNSGLAIKLLLHSAFCPM